MADEKRTLIFAFGVIRNESVARLLGILFFIGMMATGYYYNLTFVQFGLLDLGVRLVDLGRQQVAWYMAVLAALTSLVGMWVGWLMMRRGWSERLPIKLRLAFGVVLSQAALTAVAPSIRSQTGFLAWIVLASLALGVGVPATFSMTVDLVPVRQRGIVAALITAGAYFPAAVLSSNWTIETFSTSILWLMVAGAAGLAVLVFVPNPLLDLLSRQHRLPEFELGRFIQLAQPGSLREARLRRSLIVLFILMFGIYFVDSLGFLRLAEEPFFFETAWQSPDLGPRLMIGVTHVIAALVAGVLYTALNEKELFLWVFGIFALVHMMYTFTVRSMPSDAPPLSEPFLYAIAVSLYTVINFAIWADVSTPRTISRNTALGVALSAWTATFISTALALQMRQSGVPLETHFRIVDSLALLFFLVVLVLIFFAPGRGRKKERETLPHAGQQE